MRKHWLLFFMLTLPLFAFSQRKNESTVVTFNNNVTIEGTIIDTLSDGRFVVNSGDKQYKVSPSVISYYGEKKPEAVSPLGQHIVDLDIAGWLFYGPQLNYYYRLFPNIYANAHYRQSQWGLIYKIYAAEASFTETSLAPSSFAVGGGLSFFSGDQMDRWYTHLQGDFGNIKHRTKFRYYDWGDEEPNEFSFFGYPVIDANFFGHYGAASLSVGRMWRTNTGRFSTLGWKTSYVAGVLKTNDKLPSGSDILDQKFGFMTMALEFSIGLEVDRVKRK